MWNAIPNMKVNTQYYIFYFNFLFYFLSNTEPNSWVYICPLLGLYLCDMCGPSEYAQQPYFYLPSVGVVTTDILGNRKASAWVLSADLTDDHDHDHDLFW